jgi:hypothetical protein
MFLSIPSNILLVGEQGSDGSEEDVERVPSSHADALCELGHLMTERSVRRCQGWRKMLRWPVV